MSKHNIQNDTEITKIIEEKNNPKTYTENEVLKLLIQCKDRFGGSELHDYTTDSEVELWFNRVKK